MEMVSRPQRVRTGFGGRAGRKEVLTLAETGALEVLDLADLRGDVCEGVLSGSERCRHQGEDRGAEVHVGGWTTGSYRDNSGRGRMTQRIELCSLEYGGASRDREGDCEKGRHDIPGAGGRQTGRLAWPCGSAKPHESRPDPKAGSVNAQKRALDPFRDGVSHSWQAEACLLGLHLSFADPKLVPA